MPNQEVTAIRFTLGRASDQGGGEPKALPWPQFKAQFKEPLRTKESRAQYDKLPEAEQKRLKMLAGWWYRAQNKGKRRKRDSALPSDLITLDFDYATPEFFKAAREGRLGVPWDYFIHTSRRHTPEKPRFRLVIRLKKAVPNDLYGPVSRIAASYLDPHMVHVDAVSFRQAQMMYMPTASKDGEYVFAEHAGQPLDYEALLDEFDAVVGDWHDLSILPKATGEKALRQTADKAEDPTEKDGPVGYFCRAHTVFDAIDEFDLPYEPTEGNRFTYTLGTTTDGAEAYDEGLFMYSHHGSDPCSDQLVNAFDLVRIHRFGDLDAEVDDDTAMRDRPSWKAMIALCEEDEGYRRERTNAKYDLEAMFQDMPEEDQADTHDPMDPDLLDVIGPFNGYITPEAPKSEIGLDRDALPFLKNPIRRRPKPKKDWVDSLETTQNGDLIAHLSNVTSIISHDTRFRDSLWFNLFTNTPVLRLPINTKIAHLQEGVVVDSYSGDPLEDYHYDAMRVVLETPNGPGKPGWGLKVSDRDLKSAVNLACRENTFHPIREAIESTTHDGVARAESLFIRYLGCPDTPYYRDACRLFLLAAVVRVYEPGHKFDYVPVLWGGQGIRKSTFIATLAMQWFGELKGNFKDEKTLAEQMMGKWIMEIPELAAMARSEVEDVKAFLSALESHVRLSYDKNPSLLKRQCVFMGSTNNLDFLKDPTGNRRFWPIEVAVGTIDTEGLAREIPQVYAEVFGWYKAMRAAQPHGALPLYMTNPESEAQAKALQERSRRHDEVDLVAEYLHDYLEEEVPVLKKGKADFDAPKVHREYVTIKELDEVLKDHSVKVQGNPGTAIAQALGRLGWIQEGRRMIGGLRTTVYVPGPAVSARWKSETAVI